MSRASRAPPTTRTNFPRVSGDEPLHPYHLITARIFSPRERG